MKPMLNLDNKRVRYGFAVASWLTFYLWLHYSGDDLNKTLIDLFADSPHPLLTLVWALIPVLASLLGFAVFATSRRIDGPVFVAVAGATSILAPHILHTHSFAVFYPALAFVMFAFVKVGSRHIWRRVNDKSHH